MSFEIKRATRVGIIPWIDLYSESGCGKTMSALLLARGIAGPDGKIVMIDTESGRGSLYADVIEGGYEVLTLDAPFSPARYIEALDAAAKHGAGVVVVDSMSHEWEGLGSVCDMAAEIEEKSGKGLHCWKKPKMEHAKMVQHMLRFPVPLICCIRAKYKTRQTKDDKGKTVIVKDETTSPIQAEDFIFEATAHAEILPNHSIILTKCSHPSLRDCFPTREQGPITIEHGQRVARWCAAPGQSPAARPHNAKELRDRLWKLLPGEVRKTREWAKGAEWLRKFTYIADNEDPQTMTPEQLTRAIEAVETGSLTP